MPALPRRSHATAWWLTAAAALLIAVVAVWTNTWHQGWRVLRSGDTIARATRIERRGIGIVDIAAGTLLRFEGGNRLALEHGTIHAKTIAPPGIFVVDTPSARAVDLGCEYTLTVAANGVGVLLVTAGWVSLNSWGQSLVPRGARAIISADGRLSPPVFEDASPEFRAAIFRGDIDAALPLARRRDALTLINLFRVATPDERTRIYERLNALVPAPPGVTPESIEPWWPIVMKASGVSAIKKKVSSRRQ
jgi:hypothetical protein